MSKRKDQDRPEVTLTIDREKLKEWRGERTYDEAARLCGVSKSMYFMVEAGTRPDIRLATLGKIAKAMGVEPEELLVWETKR